MIAPVSVASRLASVRARIAQACARAGREPTSVQLVCVTKGIAGEAMSEAIAAGVTDLGENRVQEARQKQIALGSRLKAEGHDLEPRALSLEPIRWHLIGHLQRNKAKDAVELFEIVHSVDSVALAEALEHHASKHAKVIEAFVQVNVSGDSTKFGCALTDTLAMAETVCRLSHLRLRGLMTLAPFVEQPEAARPHFRRLRELRDALLSHLAPRTSHLELSMGMSNDFEVAIEEGADVVRIGTAVFGNW